MAFTQTGITGVRVAADGPDLFVAWSSTLPGGTIFQVYVDRRLSWHGAGGRCHVPLPSGGLGRNIWVEVGAVAADEPTRDYSSSLAAPGGRSERARLTWSGGTYLDPSGRDDVRGFRIYRSPHAGAAVDLTSVVDTVVAYPGGWINDGYGKGGFGGGGFGRAATLYEWQSPPLGSGVWRFLVVPFDRAGNPRGSGQPAVVEIRSSPRPPARDADGTRLRSTYAGPSSRYLTLNWLPSPSE